MLGISPSRTIEDLQSGDHLCCIYDTEEEHRELITPYLKRGLENHEKVVYVADARTEKTVLGYLQDTGVEVEPYLSSGQLSVLSVEDSYMASGEFDPDRMIGMLTYATEKALAEGYRALRVTGEASWALHGLPGSERYIEYEAKLNLFFPGSKCLAICQYDSRMFGPSVLLNVLATHPMAIFGTELFDNFYYVPPAESSTLESERATLDHRVSSLRKRKAVEDALRQSETYHRALVENTMDCITVLDESGTIVYESPSITPLLGYTQEELVGKSFIDYIHPEDIPGIVEAFTVGKQVSGYSAHLEVRFKHKDGSWRNFWGVGRNLLDDPAVHGVILNSRDITERKQAEEALRQSEERIRATLDSLLSPDLDVGTLDLVDFIDMQAVQSIMDDFYKLTDIGVAVCDLQGRVLVATGWQDICTKFHRVHPMTLQNCLESDTLLSGGVEPGEFKIYRCKNNMYDIATPILVGGKHAGNLFLGQFFFEDEVPDSEVFRLQAKEHGFDEREYMDALEHVPRWSREKVDAVMTFYAGFADLISTLGHSNIKLLQGLLEKERLMDSLKRSNAELSGYAHTVSHDIKAPLSAVTMAADILSSILENEGGEVLKGDAGDALRIIGEGIRRALGLTGDLLALAQAGKAPETTGPVVVSEVVRLVLGEKKEQLEERGVRVGVDDELGVVAMDRTHAYQVFANLIGNAIRHNDSENPEIQISFLGEIKSGALRYLVRDNGSGVPEGTEEYVFLPFHKGAFSVGTGIGLSIVEKVVKLSGGEVRAYNDNGACFEFTLPIYSSQGP